MQKWSSFSCSSILVNKPPSPRLAPAAINSLYESTLLGLLPDHFCTDSAEIGLNDARGAMRLSDLHMRVGSLDIFKECSHFSNVKPPCFREPHAFL
ncbi:hypothetical protein Y032_0006g2986 [Ancylostoma ceylanicum]|uniref:Uncharacterized protein n=1 Tax=Ancylostoma ceylanicum TaxID=53326 RepID=A0A016VRQ7_9BILA|nr:hypothetical protein Y032_0006g2986 [Ancylostoma ceylanicum]